MQPERGSAPLRPPAFPRSSFRVDRSWIPAGALLAAHLAVTAFGERPLGTSIGLGLATSVLLLVLVMVHALAHQIAAWLSKAPKGAVRLYIFGDISEAPRTAGVALIGPIVSAVIGGLLLLEPVDGAFEDVLRTGAWASLGLAVVNLVPGLPMDGGHLLASWTRRRRLAMRTGQLFGLIAVVTGIWLLFSSPAVVDDTASGLWLLLVGIFILVEGRATGTAIQRIPLDGQTAGSWARPFAGRVKADDPVPLAGGPFAVSDGSRLAGVLASVADTPYGARCRDVMVPWTSDIGVRSTSPVREALTRLADPEHPHVVVVVDEEGIVRGVIDEESVRERIAN